MSKIMEELNLRLSEVAPETELKGKTAIRAILARAADDVDFQARMSEHPEEALKYYILNPEEMAALLSGDIRKIETWLGKLDQEHAAWLYSRLSQEKW